MKQGVKIVLHAAFWFYIFAWHNVIGSFFSPDIHPSLSYYFDALSISHYILFPAVFYCNYFFILPSFYKPNKIANAWTAWIANPNDTVNANIVKTKLRDLYMYLLKLAEYQLA